MNSIINLISTDVNKSTVVVHKDGADFDVPIFNMFDTVLPLSLNPTNVSNGLGLKFYLFSIDNNDNFVLRYYKWSKKIVVSSNQLTDYNYSAIDFGYENWKCLICRKLCKKSEPNCFCKTYSKCWSPIDGKIKGILLSNECEFDYHFNNDELSNLIL